MLSQLSINNIAVIERASIDFSAGLTVMTGETGAGKSIIVDAINAVLGERTSKELIRTGSGSASVFALFTDIDENTLDFIRKEGYQPEEDGSILIQREIRAEGKSFCKLNGAPIILSALKQIGSRLISIHGQHESYDLLSPEVHINYIDSFSENDSALNEYKELFHKLREIRRKLDSFNSDESEKARKVDLLSFQINELEEADVKLNEQDELKSERDKIRNSERITEAVSLAKILLSGDDDSLNGALSNVSEAAVSLEAVAEFQSDLEEAAGKLREAELILEDAESILRDISVDYNQSRLNEIEERLDLLYRLGLKYGDTEEKMLDFLENVRNELQEIEFSDSKRAELENEYENLKEKAIEAAKEISKKRKASAVDFTQRVKDELRFLNMPGIEFIVEIERVPLYALGCDKIRFMVSANKGEPPKPMSKIASGGELSRIMLAIKTVLAGKDGIDTLIFDEIDNGISGEAGNKVGEKLQEVSKNRQVICITHLAQIAAYADNHLYISKSVENERTYTNVEELSYDKRKYELARIIGGDDVTEMRLNMAEEMLIKSLDK